MKLGVVMDPILSIQYHKDSTLAMLWEAQSRHWEIYYFELQDLFLRDGVAYGDARRLAVFHDPHTWFKWEEKKTIILTELDIILMRKDPPFNDEYIYTTYLLDYAERGGVRVINKPQSLRDANEKVFSMYFPACCPPSLVTRSIEKLHTFFKEHHDIVCKPLHSMGGKLVFRLHEHDANANVIFDTLTNGGMQHVMAQRFIPEIKQGDKRILMINGEPVHHVLARMPQPKDWRGNLAVGAKGEVRPLSARDHFICSQVGPELRARGLYFVGLDVIGDYLTEINVTSPTGIREIEAETGLNISAMLFDSVI
ncbi:MAG: glutathione synthase [Gammaproteobacteria bacterium RIFCSPHIGHO2_12_FULL_37_34]|nr:MAG: glutathione synthase [Gammaproteobacteria bacterium RIFCSPHIGHO2_12_FULL_37_34]